MTAGVSDVVEALSVYGAPVLGLVMPVKVMRTWSPGLIAAPVNSEHSMVRPEGPPQLPTLRPSVASCTDDAEYPPNVVRAGNVITMRLLAACEMPPVDDASMRTTYWVVAEAADGGGGHADAAERVAGGNVEGADVTGAGSDVVVAVIVLAPALVGFVMPPKRDAGRRPGVDHGAGEERAFDREAGCRRSCRRWWRS